MSHYDASAEVIYNRDLTSYSNFTFSYGATGMTTKILIINAVELDSEFISHTFLGEYYTIYPYYLYFCTSISEIILTADNSFQE